MFALSFLYNPFVDAILKEKPLNKGFFYCQKCSCRKICRKFIEKCEYV